MAAEQEKRDQARSAVAQVAGRLGRSLRTHPHLQLSAGPRDDHRINLTLYKLADVMNGDLETSIQPLQQEYQAEQLARIVE